MSDPQPAGTTTAGPSSSPSTKQETTSTEEAGHLESSRKEATKNPTCEDIAFTEEDEDTYQYLLSRLPDAGEHLPAHEKADLAQEILAMRKEHQPGKVKEHAKNIAIKCNVDKSKDSEGNEEELDVLNEIMKQLSMAEGEEGERKTKEELLQIYLGFNSQREIDLKVKIEGELNLTILL